MFFLLLYLLHCLLIGTRPTIDYDHAANYKRRKADGYSATILPTHWIVNVLAE